RRRDVFVDVMLAHDAVVLERRDDRYSELARNRTDEPYPLRGEPRREYGKCRNVSLRQPGLEGISVHHLAVAQNVRATDVESTIEFFLYRDGMHQIAQHIANGDRLHIIAYPARRGHIWQHL